MQHLSASVSVGTVQEMPLVHQEDVETLRKETDEQIVPLQTQLQNLQEKVETLEQQAVRAEAKATQLEKERKELLERIEQKKSSPEEENRSRAEAIVQDKRQHLLDEVRLFERVTNSCRC